MAKIRVNQNKCISCGLCSAVAPEYFQISTKTNKAEVIKQPKEIDSDIKRAINGCPTQAIEKI